MTSNIASAAIDQKKFNELRKKIGELNAINNQLMKQNSTLNRELERHKLANQTYVLELKEKNAKIEKLTEALRNNQPIKDSTQTDAIIVDLRKEQRRDKEQIKGLNDRVLQLSKDLEIANQFKEELKDKDQGRQMTELINTNEELARRLQKMNRELTEYKEKVGDLNRQKVDQETEIRILKEKAGLPDDWGLDQRQTRAKEKNELEQLREHVKMLEQTNIVLDQKNKDLDAKIINQQQSYTGKGAKFNLNAHQMMLVDEYAENLRKGIEDKPYKDKSQYYEKEIRELKEQLEVYKSFNVKKDFNNVINKLNELSTSNTGGSSNTTINVNSLEKITNNLRDQLESLYNRLDRRIGDIDQGSHMGSNMNTLQPQQSFTENRPKLGGVQGMMNAIAAETVIPHLAVDEQGNTEGQFLSKINEFIPVIDLSKFPKENREQALYTLLIDSMDNATRIRENERNLNTRLGEVAARLNEGMVVKDMLIRQLFEKKSELAGKDDEVTLLRSQLEDSSTQFDKQNEKMRQRIDELYNDASADSAEARYLELLKRVSILESSKIKDQRLLNVLKEKSDLYYKNYQEVLKDIEEREKDFVKKISYLKEWKASANVTLQQLYSRLKFSVNMDNYQKLQNELQRYKAKYADLINNQVSEQKQNLELKELREKMHQDKLRTEKVTKHMYQLKSELALMSTRLELADPSYRFEVSSMSRIVEVLKKHGVNLADMFYNQEVSRPFLGSKDFKEILSRYHIDMSQEDIELLFKILSDDKDKIAVTALKTRFKKFGLSDLDGQERVLLKVKNEFGKKKQTLKEMFLKIDKDKSGLLSKDEFKKFLVSLDHEMNDQVIEDILRQMNISYSNQINYNDFITYLNLLSVEQGYTVDKFGITDWVAGHMIALWQFLNKHASFEEVINESCNELGMLSVDSLHENVLKQGKNWNKADLKYLFSCLNPKGEESDMISVQQFLESSEHIRVMQKNKDRIGSLQQRSVFSNMDSDPFYKAKIENTRLSEEINQLTEHLNILENKVQEMTSASQKSENLNMEKTARISKLHEETENLRMKLQKQENELLGRISQEESADLKKSNDQLAREMTKLRSENHQNKDLVFVLSRQVETFTKLKDNNIQQLEILNGILNNAASESDQKIELSKIANQLQVHKLQSIYYYKKQVQIMQESDMTKLSHMDIEKTLDTKERELVESNMRMRELTTDQEDIRAMNNLITRGYLTLEKQDELKDLQDTVQKEYKSMSDQRMQMHDKLESTRISLSMMEEKDRQLSEMLKNLKNNANEEIKRQVEVKQKYTETKLDAMKFQRQEENMREKVNQMDKVYNDLLKRIKNLEEENVKLENKGFEQDEEFRNKQAELNKSMNEMTMMPGLGNGTLDQTHNFQETWKTHGGMNQTVNLNNSQLGFNRVMVIQNKQVELEAANRNLREEKSQQELEIRNLNNLLEKYQEIGGSKDSYQNPAIKGEMDRLNIEFKDSVEQELNEKTRKANKTISSLKEIIDQKNADLDSREHDVMHLRKKVEEIQIFYEDKVRQLQVQLDEKDRNYLRSLKDLGKVDLSMQPQPAKSSTDLKAFQDMMEMKDKEMADMQIKNNGQKSSMREMQKTLDELRSMNVKMSNELEIEKGKNSTKVQEKQLNKLKKDITKKDKDIDEYRRLVDQLKQKMFEFVGQGQTGHSKTMPLTQQNLVQNQRQDASLSQEPIAQQQGQPIYRDNTDAEVENAIVDKTKYNNVYDMKRKVDTIQKQVVTYKEKDQQHNKDLANLNSEVVKQKELCENQLIKQSNMQARQNTLNNEQITLKNKCSILEKTVDNKGDKQVEKLKDVIEKIRRSGAYASIRDLSTFEFYTQDEFVALFKGQLEEADLRAFHDYAKEKAQSRISNQGILQAVEPYLIDIVYNFDLLNFVYQELCGDRSVYEAFSLAMIKDTKAISEQESILKGETDYKNEISELLRIKDKHLDHFDGQALKIMTFFVFKYKFVAQLRQGSLNVSKIVKLDNNKNFEGEIQVPETVQTQVHNVSSQLKASLNVQSVQALVQGSTGASLYLPQFDALCRRIFNYFSHKKIDLASSLNKSSYKIPALITVLDQYGLKMDQSEKITMKELCLALEGLDSRNINEDAFKVNSTKLVEYISRYKKVTSDPGYKPQAKPKESKKEDPVENDEKTELTNKLSKEKMKNIELRDKVTISANKNKENEIKIKEQDIAIEKLKDEKAKLVKESITLNEKLRKTNKNEAIPFKKIEELQELKSNMVKQDQIISDKDRELAKVNAKLVEAEEQQKRVSKEQDQLTDLHEKLKADQMVFTHEGKKENLSYFSEKNNFISNLNHMELESKSLVLENERLSKEVSSLKRDQVDLKLGKEQAEVKLKRVEERMKELEEQRALVSKLRQKTSVKPAHEKTEEEKALDQMDIQTVYLAKDKEQEQQAFIYELKKQMESIMSENIKLSEQNKKVKKQDKTEENLKKALAENQQLKDEYADMKKKNEQNASLLESFQQMKKMWENNEKESKKYQEICRNMEDENASLKVRMQKIDKENKELKDQLRIKDK